MSIGIIIQARTTSTRLPNKVVMPFYDKKSIIEILIDRISAIHNYPIVLATTSNASDDVLINVAKSKGIQTFRGDEHNVLQRFIGCAEQYEFKSIIRVCADNPFLDIHLIESMVNSHIENNSDYTSYHTSTNIPAMKTHYGLFSEIVELSALNKVKEYSNEPLYKEHVTNYIYGHPEKFELNFLRIPEYIENSGARLTLDSKEDWDILTKLYDTILKQKPNFNSQEVIKEIENSKEILNIMQSQIKKFSK